MKLVGDLRPLVFAVTSEAVEGSTEDIKEIGGLSCRGFSWSSETPYKVFIVTLDCKSKPTVYLKYSADGKV